MFGAFDVRASALFKIDLLNGFIFHLRLCHLSMWLLSNAAAHGYFEYFPVEIEIREQKNDDWIKEKKTNIYRSVWHETFICERLSELVNAAKCCNSLFFPYKYFSFPFEFLTCVFTQSAPHSVLCVNNNFFFAAIPFLFVVFPFHLNSTVCVCVSRRVCGIYQYWIF